MQEQRDARRVTPNNNEYQYRLRRGVAALVSAPAAAHEGRPYRRVSSRRIKQEPGTVSRPGKIGAIPEFQFPE